MEYNRENFPPEYDHNFTPPGLRSEETVRKLGEVAIKGYNETSAPKLSWWRRILGFIGRVLHIRR